MTENVPPGFARHFRKSPVTDPWEPLYSRRDGDIFCLGLRIAKSHCNARGMLHGGVISALADNALGISCVLQAENMSALTINLSTDFLSTGNQIDTQSQRSPLPAHQASSLDHIVATGCR